MDHKHHLSKAGSRKMTPLLVIAAFLSVAETVAGISLAHTTGWIQALLAIFFATFTALVAIGFFVFLWCRPLNLYAPSDYSDGPPPGEFLAVLGPRNNPTGPAGGTANPPVGGEHEPPDASAGPSASPSERPPSEQVLEEWAGVLQSKLAREIERLSLADIDLCDVIQFLREYADVNIVVDWRAFYELGIEHGTKLTMDLRRISVRVALDRIIQDINSIMPPEIGIVHLLAEGCVRLTTVTALERERERARLASQYSPTPLAQ